MKNDKITSMYWEFQKPDHVIFPINSGLLNVSNHQYKNEKQKIKSVEMITEYKKEYAKKE